MHSFPFLSPRTALVFFRVAVALLLATHGAVRLYMNGPPDFGAFLNSKGFMIGTPIAWFLTIFEIVGGGLMALGQFTRWIAAIFIVEIAMGIVLVHAQNGWFVVGLQNGGVEYSVLLIVSLLTIAATADRAK